MSRPYVQGAKLYIGERTAEMTSMSLPTLIRLDPADAIPIQVDAASMHLPKLLAAEWSDREPDGRGGAWLACPICAHCKIDLKGHAQGCLVAEAIIAVSGGEDAVAQPKADDGSTWVVRFPGDHMEEFLGLGMGTGEWSARHRVKQWRATVRRDLETGEKIR